MKAYKVVLFLLCIALGLGLLACYFPADGIRVAGIDLRFPSLHDVLAKEEPVVEAEEPEIVELSPEELMAQRMEALHAARDSEYMAYCTQSPTRLFMSDITYLDPLFEALEGARQRPVRILHYGDSQLEGDRMTGVLRERLQDVYGGSGVGLLPAVQTIGMATATVRTTPVLQHYMYFGSSDFHAPHKRYGPLAQVAEVDTAATFVVSVHGGSTYSHCRSFSRVSVAMKGSGEFTVRYGEHEQEMTCPYDSTYPGLRLYSATLARATSQVTIEARGQMEVYAIMADGSAGVQVDNIAMRGCSGTIFTSIERATLAPFFQQQNVALVILQFGGNSVPYLKDSKGISAYKRQLMAQINLFHRLSPQARILLIGPSDMAMAEGEEWKTYPRLPEVVDSLREAALESGAAFWDMFRAMGGRGSMVKWVNANPQLAGEDYIHFTPRGARHMSELLCKTFDFYHEYYRFRHHLDEEETTADSLKNDTSQNISPAVPSAAR